LQGDFRSVVMGPDVTGWGGQGGWSRFTGGSLQDCRFNRCRVENLRGCARYSQSRPLPAKRKRKAHLKSQIDGWMDLGASVDPWRRSARSGINPGVMHGGRRIIYLATRAGGAHCWVWLGVVKGQDSRGFNANRRRPLLEQH